MLDEQAATEAGAAVNAARAGQFDSARGWVWCDWRNQVTAPDGRRAVMRDALRGRLARLLR